MPTCLVRLLWLTLVAAPVCALFQGERSRRLLDQGRAANRSEQGPKNVSQSDTEINQELSGLQVSHASGNGGGAGAGADSGAEDFLLFIGINTGPANVARRADVRGSWLSDSKVNGPGPIQARFIVGRPIGDDADKITAALNEEEAVHQDFLRLPVDDSYDTLTKKTFAFLRWFSSPEGPRPRFVMKLDDDSFPHLGLLSTQLRAEAERTDYTYLGYFHKCALVRRDGKNAESFEEFPNDYFPTYASGSGYVLSAMLARDLVSGGDESRKGDSDQPMLYNEDASVGVWVDRETASKPVDFTPISATLYGCNSLDSLSMNLEVGIMQCMWKKQMLGVSDICCDSNNAKLAMLQGGVRKECGPSPPLLKMAAEERNSSSQLQVAGSVNMSRMSGNITHVSSLLHIEGFVRRPFSQPASSHRVKVLGRLQKQ